MSHVRVQIKKAVQACLKAHAGLSGVLVEVDRDDDFAAEEMPAVNVHTLGSIEELQELSKSRPALVQRVQSVFVDCYARYSSHVVFGVDELTAAVEVAVLSVPNVHLVAPLVKHVALATTGTDKDSANSTVIARARMVFKFTCQTRGDPSVPV